MREKISDAGDTEKSPDQQKNELKVGEGIFNDKGEKLGEMGEDGRMHFVSQEATRQYREMQVPKEKTLQAGDSVSALSPALVVYREEYDQTLRARLWKNIYGWTNQSLTFRGISHWAFDKERHGFAKYMRGKYGVHVMQRRGGRG